MGLLGTLAHMRTARFILPITSSFHSSSTRAFSRSTYSSQKGGYYILAPDMPSDTAENNVILKTPEGNEKPSISAMKPYPCYRGFIKRLLLFESAIDTLDHSIDDDKVPQTVDGFETIMNTVEEHLVPLTYTYSMINLLHNTGNPATNFPNIEEISRNYAKTKGRRMKSTSIYHHLLDINSEVRTKLNRHQRRMIDKYLLEGKLHGLHLPESDYDGFKTVLDTLDNKSKAFLQNIQDSNIVLKSFITEPAVLNSLPRDFLNQIDRNWNSTDSTGFYHFMGNCTDRFFRREFWDTYNRRAHDKKHTTNNSVVIEELRQNRNIQAKSIGFDNYLQLSLETRMASHLDNIRAMINTLHVRSRAAYDQDLKELGDFASDHSKGQVDNLELWNLDYYKNLYMKEQLNLDTDIVPQGSFPLSSVLQSIFNLCNRLFQTDVVESKGPIDAWSPYVRQFDISCPNGPQGSMYLDCSKSMRGFNSSFARVDFILPKSDLGNTKPLCALMINLPRPALQGQDIYLTFSEVTKLFGCFGSVLQHTLTEVSYSEVNGLMNMEWDTIKLIPEFMALFPLYDHQVISDCSQGSITEDQHKQLQLAHTKFSSIKLTRDLYKSALDVTLHSTTEFWVDVQDEIWKTYMNRFSLEKKDVHLCSSADVMVQSPCSIYAGLWGKMCAADIFTQLHKNGSADESFGTLIRETFMNQSGGRSTAELFKLVMERNPSAEPLLRTMKACILHERTE